MFYRLNVLGLKRDLPILKSPSGIYIAGFNPVGDMELICKAGEELAGKIVDNDIEFDVILTTELKGLPIAQEVARKLKCDYVCLRKEKKCYMLNPKHTSGESITSGKSDYFVSELDLEKLKNKKVIFVDDVFSTGSTFKNMISFAQRENFKIVAGLSILREGESEELKFVYQDVPVFVCGHLPLPQVEREQDDNINNNEI